MIVLDNITINKASSITNSAAAKLRRLFGSEVQVRFIIKDEMIKIDYTNKTVVETIIETVAEYFKLTVAEIKGKGREEFKTDPRCMCYTLILDYAKPAPSLKKIGIIFSGRDHSTIIHGLKKFKDMYQTEPLFRKKFNDIVQLLDFKLNNKKLSNDNNEQNG